MGTSLKTEYAELDEPRPETRETDLYWKKKPIKKRPKKKKKATSKCSSDVGTRL